MRLGNRGLPRREEDTIMSDIPESGNCYKCSDWLGKEFYCYGCKEFICDDMDCGGLVVWSLASATGPGHMPDDHWIEADDPDDDRS